MSTFGDLMSYVTGEYVRPATSDELQESITAAVDNDTGAFSIDGVTYYVSS